MSELRAAAFNLRGSTSFVSSKALAYFKLDAYETEAKPNDISAVRRAKATMVRLERYECTMMKLE